MDLSEKLLKYSSEKVYPMHMPGHKRNTLFYPEINPLSVDITEIDGFDNLHNPCSVIKFEEDRLSRIFGSFDSVMCVNGSTAGIMSSVFAMTKQGDTVIIAHNCHISVFRAAMLRGLNVVFVNPDFDEKTGICFSVNPENVEKAFKDNPEIKAVILTSPTYEGVVSDIETICNIAHSHNAGIIVDEAHGAHFALSPFFPGSAIEFGADIVVQSLHKTLPCFTGTSVVHVNCSDLSKKVRNAMNFFETSSPSYVLMSGVSHCMSILEKQKDFLFSEYIGRLNDFYTFSKTLGHLSVFCSDNIFPHTGRKIFDFDKGKIVITTEKCSINAKELYEILLKDYKIQCEMHSAQYIICMTSIADTKAGFDRLKSALSEIDKTLSPAEKNAFPFPFPEIRSKYSLSQCENIPSVQKNIVDAVGSFSGDFVFAYPPGVPVSVPGGEITQELLTLVRAYLGSGVVLSDSNGIISQKLTVLDIDNT